MGTAKQNTAMVTANPWDWDSSSPYDALARQYISDPLTEQTISGYVKGQLRVYQANSGDDFCRAIIVKVVSNDGSTVRGTLLSHFPASLTSEFATSLTNRYYPPSTALTPVDAEDGDRIVVEIGWRDFNATSWIFAYFRFGDDAASDLPENETSTDDYNPWIEFSADLEFKVDPEIDGSIAVSLTPSSQVDQGLFVDGSVAVSLGASSSTEFDLPGDVAVSFGTSSAIEICLAGSVSFSLAATGELGSVLKGAATVVLGATAALEIDLPSNASVSLSASSVLTVELTLTGNASLALTLSSEVLCDVDAVGNIAVELVVTNIDLYVTQITELDLDGGLEAGGETDISTALGTILETSGGVAVWGPGDFGDLETEILGPTSEIVEFAGGATVEGAFEFDIPTATTYEYEVAGAVGVGGEFGYEFFDPSTLTPSETTLSGGVAVGGSLTGTAEYVTAEDLIVELDLSGGVAVGELRLPLIETTAPAETEAEILTLTLRGGVFVGGALGFDQEEATVYEHTPRFGGVKVGGNCVFLTLVPPSYILELAGGLSVGGTAFPGEEYPVETWALNGFLLSPALYSGLPFNSYCQYRNQAYAAGEDGIYLLEGEDDDGASIYSGLRIGPTNFGVDNIKRLRAVYPGVAGDPELRVEGERYQQEGFYPLSRRDRFDVGREVQDRVMVLEVHDFDELSHVEFAVMPLMRR